MIEFVKFTNNTHTNQEFCFSTDYTIEEMTEEINKNDFWLHSLEPQGDWTRVPVIKHKLKLVQSSSVWNK